MKWSQPCEVCVLRLSPRVFINLFIWLVLLWCGEYLLSRWHTRPPDWSAKLCEDVYGSFDEIALVDMTDMASPSLAARQVVVDREIKACSDVGFFLRLELSCPTKHILSTRRLRLLPRYFTQSENVKMENHIHGRPDLRCFEPLLETRRDPEIWRSLFLAGFDETDGSQNLPFPPATVKRTSMEQLACQQWRFWTDIDRVLELSA